MDYVYVLSVYCLLDTYNSCSGEVLQDVCDWDHGLTNFSLDGPQLLEM